MSVAFIVVGVLGIDMSLTSFTQGLLEHKHIEEVQPRELPPDFPETTLDRSHLILRREYPSMFIAIREGTTVRRIRLIIDHAQKDLGKGVPLNPYDDDTDIDDIYRFLTSDYLHTPKFHFRGYLLGYNPETDLCYGLEHSNIKTYEPENCRVNAFDNLSFWGSRNRSFEFDPDLKAILAPESDPNSNDSKYKYVFSEAVIEVDIRRDKPKINVIPLVYDTAWEDYLEDAKGEVIRADQDYSTKLVSNRI